MSTATFMKRLEDLQGEVPDEDGMGYVTDHVQGGAGLSYVRHSHKELANGRLVFLRERFPSLFDTDESIRARYSVWLGQTDDGENGVWLGQGGAGENVPSPFPMPEGARYEAWCADDEVNWYADFGDNGELAEKYAKSLPKIEDTL